MLKKWGSACLAVAIAFSLVLSAPQVVRADTGDMPEPGADSVATASTLPGDATGAEQEQAAGEAPAVEPEADAPADTVSDEAEAPATEPDAEAGAAESAVQPEQTADTPEEAEPEAELAAGDETAPVVQAVRILNPVVAKPGVVVVEIDFTEEDTGLIGAMVSFQSSEDINAQGFSGSYVGTAQYTGTLQIEIVIPANFREGEYFLAYISVSDQANNTNIYYWEYLFDGQWMHNGVRYLLLDGKYVKTPKVTIQEEFDVAFEVALSNPNLASRLEALEVGQTGRIMIDDTSEGLLPAAAFDAIRGRDVTVVLYRDSYQWVLNGLDIVNPSKDIMVHMNIITTPGLTYRTDGDVVLLVFYENGELPGKARIRIKSDYLYNQRQLTGALYLYYLGAEGLEEEDANFDMKFDGSDKWCYLDVTHNSMFVISATPLETDQVPDPGLPDSVVTNLAFAASSAGVAKGKTMKAPNVKLTYIGTEAPVVTWASSNKKIATVDPATGKVKGIRPGKARIIARAGGRETYYTLHVYSPKTTYKVKLSAYSKHGKVSAKVMEAKGGKTVTVKATPKKGYRFLGWYDGYTRISSKQSFKYKVHKNCTLTAKFKKK